VYTVEERERLREELLAAARADPRISGAALTGSAALGAGDRWSDLDLAFGISDPAGVSDALGEWTSLMYSDHGALHHVDVNFGRAIYRVFLLASTLQVDLAFFPAEEFGAIQPTFRLLFGTSVERPHTSPASPAHLIGLGWLHALHARSCIGRGKLWQAEYMVSGVRDHTLALASRRHGLPADQGRGMDRLPRDVTAPLDAALVRTIDSDELRRAFRVAMAGFLVEIEHADPELAGRLRSPLLELQD
jgi:predicted nucleotidyltransferase